MPIAAMLSTISKALSGTMALSPTPSSVTAPVSRIPPNGTPLRLILPAKRGAEPASDIDRSMRPVEYKPALSEDNAAVSTTRFMITSTPSTPIVAKKVTNGLSPAL